MDDRNRPNRPQYRQLLIDISSLIEDARHVAGRYVNSSMTLAYFFIGKYIVEDELLGAERAVYAEETMKYLGKDLTQKFGRGFSARNLASMKKFFVTYRSRFETQQILQTVSAKSDDLASQQRELGILQTISAKFTELFQLSWSHYLLLCRIDNPDERRFYEIESINSRWNLKELERQFDSSLYERLALSRNKEQVRLLAEKGQIIQSASDTLKNPLVLEFLGLKEETNYTETDLETAIISKLEHFLLELGKGFLFAGRQVRLSFEEDHFYVDLVFYHRLLRCFVLIDLKIGKLKHQDIGQMQMYVNYYDRFVKTADENKTIGIIICKDKKDSVVKMTLPEDNDQIFASRYQLYLPSKEELKQLIHH